MLRFRSFKPADFAMPAEKPRRADEDGRFCSSAPWKDQRLPVAEEKKSALLQSPFRKIPRQA
jgi:hypothetical protein